MLNPTDDNLKAAGRYNPKDDQGVPDETDHGNFSDSILMLAVLEANIYFDGNTPDLNIFGEG